MANFFEQIAAAAARSPARPAIQTARESGVETTTYRALIDKAAATSAWLERECVARGDRVAILAVNSADWVAAYLGVLRVGAVAVPLDTAYGAAQVRTIVADAGARVLLTTERYRSVADEAVDSGHRVSAIGKESGHRVSAIDKESGHRVSAIGKDTRCRVAGLDDVTLDRGFIVPPVAAVDDHDAAAILYTSGTTADPKGVVLTHANLEAERAGALGVIHVTERDAVLGVLPLFHALAQMANLLLPLTVGARVVFLETVNSTTLLHALQTQGITVFACVPQFFYLIHQRVMTEVAARGGAVTWMFSRLIALNHRLRDHAGVNLGRRLFPRVHHALGPDMRLLITGGSRFDPAIARDLYGLGLTLLNGYGLTETSGAATVMRPGDRFTTSVGQPLPGVQVRIAEMRNGVQPSDVDARDGPGDGEILIRGPVVMREYFKRPAATEEALADGWLHTGDLGRLDADGRVYITGRLKEIIVLSSGKNLYPEEIEAHYRQSPLIKELCVLGLANPSEPAAERLHAVVVPDEDVLRQRGIVNYRELIRFELETRSVALPPHKRVLSYDIRLDPLPRTTTGKLRRAEIARLKRDAPTASIDRPLNADEQAWLADSSRHELVSAMAIRLGRAHLTPDANLELDLGLDSMERVELLAFVEERAGRRVTPEVRARIFTVRQLVEAIEAAPPSTHDASQEPREGWTRVLAEDGDAAIAADLARPTRLRAAVAGALLRLTALASRIVVRLDVSGREHLLHRGPYLICPNHQSYLDPFVLCAVLPVRVLRQVFLVGAAEYFETPWRRRFARLLNIVPVDADANLIAAMRAAATGLRLGKVLILFPEGERSIDGTLRPFRKGAAILASQLAVPVIPVALDGLFRLWPRGRPLDWTALRPWRRSRVVVQFGKAIAPANADATAGTRELERRVSSLLRSAD